MEVRTVCIKDTWYELTLEKPSKDIEGVFNEAVESLKKNQNATPSGILVRKISPAEYLKKAGSASHGVIAFFQKKFTSLIQTISTLLGIKNIDEERRLEMILSMQLFKNSDEELIKEIIGSQDPKASFSDTIRVWKKCIDESIPYLEPSLKKNLEVLSQQFKGLYDLKREIEKLQQVASLRSLQPQQEKLKNRIVGQIESLKMGTSMLIPGGIWTPDTKTSNEMIYKCTKNEDGSITVQVVDVTALLKGNDDHIASKSNKPQISAAYEKAVSKEDIENFVKKTILLQTGISIIPAIGTGGKWTLFKSAVYFVASHIQDGIFGKIENQQLREGRESVFKEIFTEAVTSQNVPSTALKQAVQVDPARLLKVFAKVHLHREESSQEGHYALHKFLMRASLYLKIYANASQKEIESPQLRSWLKVSARKLIQYAKDHPETEESKQLLVQIEQIVKRVEDEDLRDRFPVPSSPFSLFGSKRSFKAAEGLNVPGAHISGKKAVAATSITVDTNLRKRIKQSITTPDIDNLERALKEVDSQIQQGNFQTGHLYLRDFFLSLESQVDSNNWMCPKAEFVRWQVAVQQAALLNQQVSYGLKRVVPTAQDLRSTLFALRFQDMAIRVHKPNDPYSKSYVFDTSLFEKQLMRPYFSFGDSYHQILKSIEYFKALQENKASIPAVISSRNQKLSELWNSYPCTSADLDPARDIGQKDEKISTLPPYILSLRRSYLGAQVFVSPTRASVVKDLNIQMKLLSETFTDALQSTGDISDFGGKLVRLPLMRKLFEFIPKRLLEKNGPIKFTYEGKSDVSASSLAGVIAGGSISLDEKFILEPFGLAISDPDDPERFMQMSKFTDPHPDLQKANGVAVPKEIHNRLFNRAVAERPMNVLNNVHANGSAIEESTKARRPGSRDIACPFKEDGFNGKTELEIINERNQLHGLPSDLSQAIELCMTGPNSKVQNILSYFSKNITLLEDQKVGPSLARLVENTLCQQGLSAEEVELVTIFLSEQLQAALGRNSYSLAARIASMTRSFSIRHKLVDMQNSLISNLVKAFAESDHQNHDRIELIREMLLTCAYFGKTPLEYFKVEEIFTYATQIQKHEINDPVKNSEISEWLLTHLEKMLPKDEATLNSLCNSVAGDSLSGWKITPEGVATNGPYVIDFSRFEVWRNGLRVEVLPKSIEESPEYKQIKTILAGAGVTTSLSDIQWRVQNIQYTKEKDVVVTAKQFDVAIEDVSKTKIDIRVVTASDGSIQLFRRKQTNWVFPNSWYQFMSKFPGNTTESLASKVPGGSENIQGSKEFDVIPRIGLGRDVWIREDGRRLIAEKNGKTIYRCTTAKEPFEIQAALHIPSGKRILNVWDQKGFNRFLDIEDRGHVFAYGSRWGAEKIEYGRGDPSFSYAWNSSKAKWCSEQHKGYYLSDKTVNRELSDVEHPDLSQNVKTLEARKHLRKIFQPAFSAYHLLEHESGAKAPLLIMPGITYEPGGDSSKGGVEYRFSPRFSRDTKEKVSFYSYQIDPVKGLIADKQPDGYFSLAYVLALQGNYEDAFFYLGKADINRPLSLQMKVFVNNLEKLLVDESNPQVLALKARLKLIDFTSRLQEEDYDLSRVDIEKESREFSKILSALPKDAQSKVSLRDDEMRRLEYFAGLSGNSDILDKLRKQVNELEKTLPPLDSSGQASSRELEVFQGEVHGVIQVEGLDPYAKELASGLNKDYADRAIVLENHSKDLKGQPDLKKLQEKTKTARDVCINILKKAHVGSKKSSFDELLERLVLVQGDSLSALFDASLRSFGERDLDKLKPVLKDDYKGYENALREYLIQKTELQKQTALVQKYQELKKLGASSEEGKQIQIEIRGFESSQRAYDPNTHKDAPTLLLIEHELGFLCRKSQIEVIEQNLAKDNLFKQEICGGGKTTVLRNIISHVRADGKHLSGVSTLSPLRAEHGLLYARVTKNAFGQRVFDFSFDRSSPTDEISLLQLYQQLVETTLSKGRIDLTKSDLQSFRAAMHTKRDEIQNLRRQLRVDVNREDEIKLQISTLHREIDVMDRIYAFFRDRVVLNADELDKDTDPSEELNYATGSMESIDGTKIASVINVFEKIMSCENAKNLFEAVRKNEHSSLDPQAKSEALGAIASEIAKKYSPLCGIEEESLACYLFPKDEGQKKKAVDVWNTLQPLVVKNQKLQPLCFMRQFLSDILPEALSAKGGVVYGRSEDGISVIPYLGSDKPKEGSIHGYDLERMAYTCLDYFSSGVSLQQIHSMWLQFKNEAVQEMSQNKDIISIDDTKSAQEFLKRFSKKLSEVTEQDMGELSERLQSDQQLLLKFLQTNVLADLKQSPEKIASNAQDSTGMVLSYSGSSGTDMAEHAMPDKINSNEARQSGVHGEILAALIQIESKNPQSFVTFEGESPQDKAKFLAEKMKPGDCLSDVGRLFPGVSSKVIAESLLQALVASKKVDPSTPFTVWFMDRQDRWQMVCLDETVTPADPKQDPKLRIAIFDDVHTRGAERPSTENVTEYVTLDIDTDWSKFEQGVLRERGVTKGKAKVVYLLSPLLAEKVTSLKDLNPILLTNEAKNLKQLNLKNQIQTINYILRSELENAFVDLKSLPDNERVKKREEIHALTREIFVSSNTTSALDAGTPSIDKETDEYLDELVQRQLHMLKKLRESLKDDKIFAPHLKRAQTRLNAKFSKEALAQKQLSDEERKEVQNLIKQGFGRKESRYLPDTVRSSSLLMGQSSQVQIQSQIQTQVQAQTQIQVQTQVQTQTQQQLHEELEKGKERIFAHIAIDLPDPRNLNKEKNVHKLNQIASFEFMPEGLYFSENYCPVVRTDNQYTPWKPNVNHIERSLFIIDDTGQVSQIIGSRLDLDREFYRYSTEKHEGFSKYFYNYGLGKFEGGHKIPASMKESIYTQVISAKLLSLQSTFSQEELPYLKKIIGRMTPDTKEKIRILFSLHRPSLILDATPLGSLLDENKKFK